MLKTKCKIYLKNYADLLYFKRIMNLKLRILGSKKNKINLENY